MDEQRLLTLLSRDEGPKLDYKLKLSYDTDSGKKELAKDICAIANTRGGRGYIIFGIEDKTKIIAGIDNEEFQEEKIQQIVSTRIDPPVPISVETLSVSKKTIGIITIYNTEQKPHQVRDNGAFYIRRGSTTDIMRKEELASMLQDMGLVSYELLPLIKADINTLNSKKISDYLKITGFSEKYDNNILIGSGIAVKDKDSGEVHPSCGGMLLFGKNPQEHLPHAIIKVNNYKNNEAVSSHISTGNIFEMLEDSLNFICESMGETAFPAEIIKSLLGKSVLFRDYFDINNIIQVNLFPEKIEIANPGSALKGLNNSEKYVRRNTWLYMKVIALDKGYNFFSRDINVNQLVKPYGNIKYINILSKNIFKVIIPLKLKARK